MSIDTPNFRDALRPQDGVAVIITLLGAAILLFLQDSVIKLIGGSIALLGGAALYMTIKQRMADQVQLRVRRTTLPPPAFKTTVTKDPTTSAKRIVFDDFQETFEPDDDEEEERPVRSGGPAPGPVRTDSRPDRNTAAPRTPAEPVPHRFDDISDNISDNDGHDVPADPLGSGGAEEGSFRVVTPGVPKKSDRPAAAEPSSGGSRTLNIDTEPASTGRVRSSGTSAAATVEAERRQAPEREGGRPEVTEQNRQAATAEAPEPIAVPTDAPVRRQVRMILDDLIAEGEDDGRGGSEPRAEFVRLVAQVLNAIARSIGARSIIFFWANLDRGHLMPEAKVTTGAREIMIGRRLPLGNDVVSQIARSGVPEIITDISPVAERDLITYYAGPADTRSFVGVPVFFRSEVVGVLVADSTEENGFDEGAVATLAEYTRLISGLIRGYTEKYDLHLIADTLASFERMHGAFTGASLNPSAIAQILVEEVAALFDVRYAAAVLFDDVAGDWKVAACRGEDEEICETLMQTPIDVNYSVAGHSTRFAEEVHVESASDEIRFTAAEPLEGSGTLLALPFVAAAKCYGAIVMEHPSPSAYIPRDIDLLRDLVRYAAMAIEVFNTNQAIESQTVVDEATGFYNTEFLLNSLEQEVARARDFHTHLSFAMITIDFPASLGNPDSAAAELVASSVGEILSASIRRYDILGCMGRTRFGVVLVGRNDQDAYLWAEKLRKETAGKIIGLGNKKVSVTLSIGICDLGEFTGGKALVQGAERAMDRARTSEGNTVVLY